MRARAPRFWFEPPGWRSALLWPAGRIYGTVAARRMVEAPRRPLAAPVLCIGNFTLGGGGKTPTAIALAQAAKALDLRPGFLTRGHAGSARVPLLLDPGRHGARLVGDEPMLLAEVGPVAVSPDRMAGATLLRHAGCDLFLMDDGFQSAQVRPDLAVVVVDGARGLGNGRVFPAGPLRAPLEVQRRFADALLVIGTGKAGDEAAILAEEEGKPVVRARLAAEGEELAGVRVLAFCGIADPSKFHRSLEEIGADAVLKRDFPDHHPFSEGEAAGLLAEAEAGKLVLATTAKDRARLLDAGPRGRELAERARVLLVSLRFEDEDAPVRLIGRCLAAFETRSDAI